MSGVQFVLQKPSVFFVTISGEVNKTVEKRCWSLTRLSSILEDCFTNYSSNRRIEIKSSDGSVHTYDLFMALFMLVYVDACFDFVFLIYEDTCFCFAISHLCRYLLPDTSL